MPLVMFALAVMVAGVLATSGVAQAQDPYVPYEIKIVTYNDVAASYAWGKNANGAPYTCGGNTPPMRGENSSIGIPCPNNYGALIVLGEDHGLDWLDDDHPIFRTHKLLGPKQSLLRDDGGDSTHEIRELEDKPEDHLENQPAASEVYYLDVWQWFETGNISPNLSGHAWQGDGCGRNAVCNGYQEVAIRIDNDPDDRNNNLGDTAWQFPVWKFQVKLYVDNDITVDRDGDGNNHNDQDAYIIADAHVYWPSAVQETLSGGAVILGETKVDHDLIGVDGEPYYIQMAPGHPLDPPWLNPPYNVGRKSNYADVQPDNDFFDYTLNQATDRVTVTYKSEVNGTGQPINQPTWPPKGRFFTEGFKITHPTNAGSSSFGRSGEIKHRVNIYHPLEFGADTDGDGTIEPPDSDFKIRGNVAGGTQVGSLIPFQGGYPGVENRDPEVVKEDPPENISFSSSSNLFKVERSKSGSNSYDPWDRIALKVAGDASEQPLMDLAGEQNFTVTISGDAGRTAQLQVSVLVMQTTVPRVRTQIMPPEKEITPLVLPEAEGGTAPYTYELEGDLPDGLSFDANTRTISGKPPRFPGAIPLTYSATGTHGLKGSTTFRIRNFALERAPAKPEPEFDAGPFIDGLDSLTFVVGEPVDVTLPGQSREDADQPVSYSLFARYGDRDLPPGLSFSSSSRGLTGTPTEPQDAKQYLYLAKNDAGEDSFVVSITVVPAPVPTVVPTLAPEVVATATPEPPVAPTATPEPPPTLAPTATPLPVATAMPTQAPTAEPAAPIATVVPAAPATVVPAPAAAAPEPTIPAPMPTAGADRSQVLVLVPTPEAAPEQSEDTAASEPTAEPAPMAAAPTAPDASTTQDTASQPQIQEDSQINLWLIILLLLAALVIIGGLWWYLAAGRRRRAS